MAFVKQGDFTRALRAHEKAFPDITEDVEDALQVIGEINRRYPQWFSTLQNFPPTSTIGKSFGCELTKLIAATGAFDCPELRKCLWETTLYQNVLKALSFLDPNHRSTLVDLLYHTWEFPEELCISETISTLLAHPALIPRINVWLIRGNVQENPHALCCALDIFEKMGTLHPKYRNEAISFLMKIGSLDVDEEFLTLALHALGRLKPSKEVAFHFLREKIKLVDNDELSYGEALELFGWELDLNDDMLEICGHCSLPDVTCKKRFREKWNSEMPGLLEKGRDLLKTNPQEAIQIAKDVCRPFSITPKQDEFWCDCLIALGHTEAARLMTLSADYLFHTARNSAEVANRISDKITESLLKLSMAGQYPKKNSQTPLKFQEIARVTDFIAKPTPGKKNRSVYYFADRFLICRDPKRPHCFDLDYFDDLKATCKLEVPSTIHCCTSYKNLLFFSFGHSLGVFNTDTEEWKITDPAICLWPVEKIRTFENYVVSKSSSNYETQIWDLDLNFIRYDYGLGALGFRPSSTSSLGPSLISATSGYLLEWDLNTGHLRGCFYETQPKARIASVTVTDNYVAAVTSMLPESELTVWNLSTAEKLLVLLFPVREEPLISIITSYRNIVFVPTTRGSIIAFDVLQKSSEVFHRVANPEEAISALEVFIKPSGEVGLYCTTACFSQGKTTSMYTFDFNPTQETKTSPSPKPKKKRNCRVCDKLQPSNLLCSRCKKTYYCSVECQRKDWPTHKQNCK